MAVKQKEHEIPFSDAWYDVEYEKGGIISKGLEMAIVAAGYKLITAATIAAIITGFIFKQMGIF